MDPRPEIPEALATEAARFVNCERCGVGGYPCADCLTAAHTVAAEVAEHFAREALTNLASHAAKHETRATASEGGLTMTIPLSDYVHSYRDRIYPKETR